MKNYSPTFRVFLSLLAAQLCAVPVYSGDNVTPSEVVEAFDLPGGISGEVILRFEDASGLDGTSLSIDAELIDLNNCTVCLRLPPNVFIPPRFPVLVTIEPDQEGLTFQGRWTLDLVTDELNFASNTPLRLFRARNNILPFEDISANVGFGSFRVGGFGGSFSQFVIGADLRPIGAVTAGKFNRVQTILDNPDSDIDPPILEDLNTALAGALGDWQNGDFGAAMNGVGDLIDLVIANSGDGIPDDWDPTTQIVPLSVAGLLRGSLRSLRFSLAVGDQEDAVATNTITRVLEPSPGLSLEVTLTFDQSFDIDLEDPASLGLSAKVIDPVDLLPRLPATGVSIPEDFPVLLTISPAVDQSFAGSYTLELRTENLPFVGGSPLRLFKAPDGGAFEDISSTLGVGSFRVGGFGGSFSEFLIVSDIRPIETIVMAKFGSLATFLDDNTDEVPQEILDLFGDALGHYENKEFDQAIDSLDELVALVIANRENIPRIWRPDGSVVNILGELLATVRSLRFSISVERTPLEGDAFDVNRDGVVDVIDVFLVINRVFGSTPP